MLNNAGENRDIELLAVWLNGAVQELFGKVKGHAMLRRIVGQASKMVVEMYGVEDETQEGEVNIPDLFARLAAALDRDQQVRDQE